MPSIFSGLDPISSSGGGSLDHEELNKLKTEVNDKIEALKSTQNIEYEGENATCENTLASRTSDLVVKGKTYQNFVDSFKAGVGCTIDDFINIRGTSDGVWSICDIKLKPQLNSNKIYTVIYNCIDKSEKFEVTGFDSNWNWKLSTNVEKPGINKFLISNKDVSLIRIQTNKKDTSIKIGKNIIVLEGDWTNKEVPSSITGIESAGQKENKIIILSNNSKLADDINYKQYKKEIPLPVEGGLRCLPNGVFDTIEQRNDGVYLVQRVKKMVYVNGDENNNNYLTDKVNTYKPLEAPVETKLDIQNLDLEVYKDITYVTTDNAIQPTLSFKVPSNIGDVIQSNSQNINNLYKLIVEDVETKVENIINTTDNNSKNSKYNFTVIPNNNKLKIFKIEGLTVKNILTEQLDCELIGDDTYKSWTFYPSNTTKDLSTINNSFNINCTLKPNTKYTLITNISCNDSSNYIWLNNPGDNEQTMVSNLIVIPSKKTGTICEVLQTRETLDLSKPFLHMKGKIPTGKKVVFDYIILLEGEYNNLKINSNFLGIKSSCEDGICHIINNTTGYQYDINIGAPLRSINNVHDEIINEKLIRRIGKRNYIDGDENNTALVTDLTNTLYVLDAPIISNIMINEIDCLPNISNEITTITNSVSNKLIIDKNTVPNINVSDYGIIGDGITNYTNIIKEIEKLCKKNNCKIYFPDGIYCVDYSVDTSLFTGEGKISFINMVIQNFPSHPQGKEIKISHIYDDIASSMQIPNEDNLQSREPRKKHCGAWQLDDFTLSSSSVCDSYTERTRIVPWGVIEIIDLDKLPDNLDIKIKNMRMYIFRKSTQKWELVVNDIIDGSMTPDRIAYYRTALNGVTTIHWSKSETGNKDIHFWTKYFELNDFKYSDIQYTICSYDCMVEGEGYQDGGMGFYVGGDAKSDTSTINKLENPDSILEISSGRMKSLKLNEYKRVYSTTLDYDIYDNYCSQVNIESIEKFI